MTLCDHEIVREWIKSKVQMDLPGLNIQAPPPLVDPFVRENLQPASVDLTLADEFLRYPSCGQDLNPGILLETENMTWLDKVKENPIEMKLFRHKYALLEPGGFILGRTQEWVNIPNDMVASVEGKSSLARLGIFVHVTAGFIDPGFRGTITLEFFNASPRYVQLAAGVRICQIAFQRMAHAAARPYGSPGLGSKYQDQEGTTGSKYQG